MTNSEIKLGHFKCYVCKGVFEKGRSDKEAWEDYNDSKYFIPDLEVDNSDLVCDECFNKYYKKN